MPKYQTLLLTLFLAVMLVSCGNNNADPPLKGDITALASEFIALLQQGDYAGAVSYFDKTMKTQLPQEKLSETWETIQQQAGTYQKEVEINTEEVGSYEAVIVTAQFTHGYIDIRITFNRDKRISGLYFLPAENPNASDYMPPAYGQPAKFTEQDVSVGEGEWALPGTLTIPDGSGPFPAAILIHGSGPNDRDETIGPNKPFKDLAWGLANQGIAVLRYEKRTKVHAAKLASLSSFTVKEESIDDALAAVRLLQENEKISSDKIFIAGHSLGATLAPRIGAANRAIAGLVMMAGAARPLEDLILEQTKYLAEIDGTITEAEQKQIDLIEKQITNIKSPDLTADTPPSELLNTPASYWLDLQQYDPAQTASSLTMPMFIIQGERDYQVTMEDFALWQEALAGHNNVTFKSYPNLNHLFIHGDHPSIPAEYQENGNMAETVIKNIAAWIKQH